jgi:hypothetical protein
MPKIIVISAFAVMLILAAHGQTYRALGADPETASVPPGQAEFERQVRNYFEQLERDQAAADAERRAAGISAVPAPAPPNSQLAPAPAPAPIPRNIEAPSGTESNRPIRFTHRTGRFSVVMPRTPKCSTEHFGGAAPPVTQALLLIDRSEYQVTFRDMLPEEMQILKSDAAAFDRTFQQWLDWVVQKLQARLEHRVRRAVVRQTAWEFEVVLPDDRHLIGWYVLAGNRLYQVNILGPGLTVDHPTTREFIDSFQILESP